MVMIKNILSNLKIDLKDHIEAGLTGGVHSILLETIVLKLELFLTKSGQKKVHVQ